VNISRFPILMRRARSGRRFAPALTGGAAWGA